MVEYIARFRITKKNRRENDAPYVRHEEHLLASDDKKASKKLDEILSKLENYFRVTLDKFGRASHFR